MATFWTRQLFPPAGALPVALLIGPGIAVLALAMVVAGEALESLMLARLLRRHADGRLEGRARFVPIAATLFQALGIVAAIWLLFYILDDASGHAVLIAMLAAAALNAGLGIGHAPRLVAIRLGAYAFGAAAIVATEFASDMATHVRVNEIMASS